MSVIKWDASLAIGHKEIDAQHQNLFSLVARLHDTILNKNDQMDIKETLFDLYKYTSLHFSEEEALMHKTEYAHLDEHVAMHDEFVKTLDTLSVTARRGDIHIEMDVLNWLVSWLVNHISISDKKLFTCLEQYRM
ncbi:MAG: bacteriohemerythrin [Solidesulfovibrio sp.]